MPSVFSKIITGDIPCYKIAEDDSFIAFLDINPLTLGHTLVVPKLEVDYIFDLPTELLSGFLNFAKPIAKAIEKSTDCLRVGISVVGTEVPHAHLHLIPFNLMSDLNFANPKLKLTPDQFKAIQAKIIANL